MEFWETDSNVLDRSPFGKVLQADFVKVFFEIGKTVDLFRKNDEHAHVVTGVIALYLQIKNSYETQHKIFQNKFLQIKFLAKKETSICGNIHSFAGIKYKLSFYDRCTNFGKASFSKQYERNLNLVWKFDED